MIKTIEEQLSLDHRKKYMQWIEYCLLRIKFIECSIIPQNGKPVNITRH